jgi:hypothetical protein
VRRFCDELKSECVGLEIDYRLLRTDAPLDVALSEYLELRASV